MLKKIAVFFAIILLSSITVHETHAKKSAYNIQYEVLPNKFTKTPTFCAKEPQYDADVPENLIPILMKKTRSSIDAWIGPLQSSSKRDANWAINYIAIPRNEQTDFDYKKCDVLISFYKTPPASLSDKVEIMGIHYVKDGISHVDVFYQGYGVCETRADQLTYWYICQQDSPKLIVVMETILRHEIGHAIGLGHYISEETTYLWGNVLPPSIMVPIMNILASPTSIPTDPEDIQITHIDIAKIKEIYGDMGWGNQPQKTKAVKDIVKSKTSSKQTTKIIEIRKGQTIIEKVSGNIPMNLYMKGHRADVTVLKPDGKTETQKIVVNGKGMFEHSFSISSDTVPGKYQIIVNYFGNEVKKFTYEVKQFASIKPR